MRIGIRYCGGCNPYYDAAREKAALEKAIGQKLEPVRDELPDICVVFKQCSSDCFPEPEKLSREKTIIINSEKDTAKAIELLKDLLERGPL